MSRQHIVITIDDDRNTLVRLFDSVDAAFQYQCRARMSNARTVIQGETRKAWTLDALGGAVSEQYDIPRAQVKAAFNLTIV